MNTTVRATKFRLPPETEKIIREKLTAPLRLLGDRADAAMLDIEVTQAPAEGRSSEPYRLVARLTVDSAVYHAEAVKPSPESAADRVRSELEQEIKKERGRARRLWKRGRAAVKRMLRFGGEE